LANQHVSAPELDSPYGPLHFPTLDPTSVSALEESIVATSLNDGGQAKVQHGMAGAAQQIRRLDALMFPSDDPLAYPNQPRADFGMHGPSLQHANPANVLQQHDAPSYYVPQFYDGIEGQLLGPLPPYLMQSQGEPGINFPAQMYSDPMLASHQIHPPPPQNRSHVQGLHLEQDQLRQQPKDYESMDSMFVNTSWQDMFPQHGMN
jgi:hypothetical protein